MRSGAVGLWVALAALPLSLLAHAEQGGSSEAFPSPVDAGVDPGPPPGGYAPDPVPLVTSQQWMMEVRYRAGVVGFENARRVELPRPKSTARMMGRFAAELYVGKQLIDRVRFDFPLLAAAELGGGPRRWDSPPSFERNLSAQVTVMIPHSERATRAILVDRASGRVVVLPWPFVARADAGRSPSDGG